MSAMTDTESNFSLSFWTLDGNNQSFCPISSNESLNECNAAYPNASTGDGSYLISTDESLGYVTLGPNNTYFQTAEL